MYSLTILEGGGVGAGQRSVPLAVEAALKADAAGQFVEGGPRQSGPYRSAARGFMKAGYLAPLTVTVVLVKFTEICRPSLAAL